MKLFGTDGVRGEANRDPMTPNTILRLAQAAGLEFRREGHRNRVVIGKDTRLSGYLLEPALVAGFISVGMDVYLAGPLPTPAISMLTRSLRADLGVMISASHNPSQDNGIKLFRPDGHKLSDEVEDRIAARMQNTHVGPLVPADQLGRARRLDDARGRYIQFAKSTFPSHLKLDGLKIVVDCAHGAAYKIAPNVFAELGAEVIAIANDPDGTNINDRCGATHTEALCAAVVTHGAHVGIALDGDGDRVVMCDEKGRILDGDQLIALIATAFQAQGRLVGHTVVTTVMSNMGLTQYLKTQSIQHVQTQVGDRYVFEHMAAHGFTVGGEQSGHIILRDYGPTGDGIVAALQVLAVLVADPRPASQVANVFSPYPQVLKNLRVSDVALMDRPDFQAYLRDVDKKLGDTGRLLVRKSGTEPLIRVMIEGEDRSVIDPLVDGILAYLESLDQSSHAKAL